MATLFLSTAGSSIGGLFGGVGSAIGYTIGALGGQLIDQSLFAPSDRSPHGEGASDIHVQTSAYGSPMAKVYGTTRIAGQVIWATPFKKHSGQGQGKGGRQSGDGNSYYKVSLAVALGEGRINSMKRMWFDGQLANTSKITMRFYEGDDEQQPDPLIAMEEETAPAYRGCSYVVFEDLDLSPYGNRLPQMNFEVTREATKTFSRVKAVTLIPGATEWGYHPLIITSGHGSLPYVNRNTNQFRSDVSVAIDQLKSACPNCDKISLVVAWFGDSLDASKIKVAPKGTLSFGKAYQHPFTVSNEPGAGGGRIISLVNGNPAFDSTPSDESVYELIRYLKGRGFKIMFHPFLLMDMPGYPWRGRITMVGERTRRTIYTAVNNLFPSNIVNSHFTPIPSLRTVRWDPPYWYSEQEWSYKRFLFHYATLCKMAGGVDQFLLGSELVGLTGLTTGNGRYPFVKELKYTARYIKQILPDTQVSYGANWDEYKGHKPTNSTFYFHMDEFWGNSEVGFVGVNYYQPMADWRDGINHLDAQQAPSIYDTSYLRRNIKSGENYDWYYASQEDRQAQIRSPITDGAYHKPWVWRSKDLSSWWRNEHFNRINGVESTTPTTWKPGMKPIVLTEAGCPAVDKGANEPNAFPDLSPTRSTEAHLPRFSNGARDDYMQSSFLEALLSAFDPDDPDHLDDFNAPLNGKRMLDSSDIYLWCWDARPYPWFPNNLYLWKDGVNWATGHWLSGRTSYSSVKESVGAMLRDAGFEDYNLEKIEIAMKGIASLTLGSPRDVLEALQRFFFFDIAERNGKLEFIPRRGYSVATIKAEDCVLEEDKPPYEIFRAQEETLPRSVKLHYIDDRSDYRQAVAEARRLGTQSSYVAQANLSIVAAAAEAQFSANRWLHETWIAREVLTLRLPPRWLALDVGDIITFAPPKGQPKKWRITSITDEAVRIVEAVRVEPSLYYGSGTPPEPQLPEPIPQASPAASPAASSTAPPARERYGSLRIEHEALSGIAYRPPVVAMMDLPHLRGDEKLGFHIAAYSKPPPDSLSLFRSLSGEHSWSAAATLAQEPVMGVLESAPAPQQEGRWDRATRLRVAVANGELLSRSEEDVLQGANYAAIEHENGWEIIQFATAELVAVSEQSNIYQLSNLLRALAGTESEMTGAIEGGAAFVLLDVAKVLQVEVAPAERNRLYHYRIGPSSDSYNDISFQALDYLYRGINLRPLSVVHLRAHRSTGEITLRWVRRSRDLTHSGWDEAEVLLGEEHEAYEVEVLDKNKNLLQTIKTSSPEAVFPNENHHSTLIVRVYQMSARFGRGAAREEIFHV